MQGTVTLAEVWQPCRISRLPNRCGRNRMRNVGFPASTTLRRDSSRPFHGSPQALIPVPTTVQIDFACSPYDTATVANTPNGGIWISRRSSGRAAPRGVRPPFRLIAAAIHLIPQRWQMRLMAIHESRKEYHAVASRCACRRARRRSPSIRSTAAAIRLIGQLRTAATFTFTVWLPFRIVRFSN